MALLRSATVHRHRSEPEFRRSCRVWRAARRLRGLGIDVAFAAPRFEMVLPVPVGNLIRLVREAESRNALPHERSLQPGLVGAGLIVPVAGLIGS